MRRSEAHVVARIWVLSLMLVSFVACAGQRPETLGPGEGRLAPCAESRNCVSSDDDNDRNRVEPFVLDVSPSKAWPVVVDVVYETKRTTVIVDDDGYLHAEIESALFRFVDDLELRLRMRDRTIAVRSASRVGRSDLGVNRRRVESLRKVLKERGVAH